MNFDFTSDILSSAGRKTLGQLRYKLRFLKECQYETFTKLYSFCIVPILDYASSVWGFKFYRKPETIQHRAIRYFLWVHRFAANDMIEGDIGWLSCRARRKLSVLNYWNRLVNCDTERLIFNIFQWDLRFSEKPDTWSYEVRHIFQELGDKAIFNAQLLCDLEKSYNDMFFLEQERWNCARFGFDKLRYYNLYKGDFAVEDYVTANFSKQQRSIMAQFRAGILPLEIEVGRYWHVPLMEWMCKICLSGELEDEVHFLYVCSHYKQQRSNLFTIVDELFPEFQSLNIFEKFVFLMSHAQCYTIKYLYEANQRRLQYIYCKGN